MVRVFDRSEIWDRLRASWRQPPSPYRLPDVETWGDGCTCDASGASTVGTNRGGPVESPGQGARLVHVQGDRHGTLRGSMVLVVSEPGRTDAWVYRPMLPRTYDLDLPGARAGLGGSELTADDLALLVQAFVSSSVQVGAAGSRVLLDRGAEARFAGHSLTPTPHGEWENGALQLVNEGIVTTTFDVHRGVAGEIAAVRVGHPNTTSRTVITLVERRAPGPLPACGRSLELCATLAGFVEAADIAPTAYAPLLGVQCWRLTTAICSIRT